MPPKVVGPYVIQGILGTGGVATVYRAVDRRNSEAVALKLLSTGPALDPRAARRLAREFEALSELAHPNIVRVFDTGVHRGYPYLAMELVEGLTLRQYLSLHEEPDLVHKPMVGSHSPEGDTGEWTGPSFSLSDYAEEAPSMEPGFGHSSYGGSSPSQRRFSQSISERSFSQGSFSQGPDALRRLADAADEPDTYESREVSSSLPRDLAPEDGPAPKERPPINLTHLNRPGRVARLKEVMLQLCQALSYIHGHGLIHRDLKPTNVMVDEEGVVRLMDFGLAKFLADDSVMTGTGQMVGTFRYMAPEQFLGEPVDPRTDLYSLGVILYELLSGRAPFETRTPQELWNMVLENDPPSIFRFNTQADVTLARAAQRLIRREPSERFQTAEETHEALQE
jgi:serine/threonine protein kinase